MIFIYDSINVCDNIISDYMRNNSLAIRNSCDQSECKLLYNISCKKMIIMLLIIFFVCIMNILKMFYNVYLRNLCDFDSSVHQTYYARFNPC